MRRICKLLLVVSIFIGIGSCKSKDLAPFWYKNGLETAHFQLLDGAEKYAASKSLPRSVKSNGKVHLVKPQDWTSGFFPGSLWLAYHLTGDDQLKERAKYFTTLLYKQQYNTNTHDLGFMMFCSYGNGLCIGNEKKYDKILINAANSLKSRYSPKVGFIRSWDFGKWEYPVIIDNMMNLELLFWASKTTRDSSYYHIAVNHAMKTLQNHFREDFSTYHVVSYDTLTGVPVSKGTYQGYSDDSVWSRGQAWALYGYTMCYRETGNRIFLEQAEKVAGFLIPKLKTCDDCIPFWDFDAPGIPNTPKDASAAAVIASALLELQEYSSQKKTYLNTAEEILKNLSSPKYLADKGTNNSFILKHSTGSYPHNSEVDVPLNYADYYYLEAMSRFAKLNQYKLPEL